MHYVKIQRQGLIFNFAIDKARIYHTLYFLLFKIQRADKVQTQTNVQEKKNTEFSPLLQTQMSRLHKTKWQCKSINNNSSNATTEIFLFIHIRIQEKLVFKRYMFPG